MAIIKLMGGDFTGALDINFSDDIIIDETAFNTAADDFSGLSSQLEKLRTQIEDMLITLKSGFNTPAGVKFINSCENNLLKPLDDQKLVLEHISETLNSSKQTYASVFEEYRNLNSLINSYG